MVVGWQSERRELLVVRVKAPPAEGHANKALVKVLAESLGLPKSSVSLVRGAHSREKHILLGMDAEAFESWASSLPVTDKE